MSEVLEGAQIVSCQRHLPIILCGRGRISTVSRIIIIIFIFKKVGGAVLVHQF